MKKIILALYCFFLSLAIYSNDNILIQVDGKKHSSISMEDIKKMSSINIEHFNYVTQRAELYKGVGTLAFIEKLYPEAANILEIEFIAEDNYRSFITVDRLRQTNSILAYDRADGDKFVRFSLKEKILVSVGPLYLVWDLKGVKKEERLVHSSVYQIRTINLLTNKIDFGLKENAVDSSVYLGYQVYKRQCISCHALGKIGGSYSFDLVARKTLELKGAEYVRKYILDPRSVNPRSKMLPLPKFKNAPEMVQGLLDFLKFMQNPEELLNQKKAASSEASYKVLKELIKEIK